MFKDYYKILEIPQNATDEKIKKAFREQAIKWHPDKNQGRETTLHMQEINEAYLILKDKEARTRYDVEYNKFKQFQESKYKKAEQERSKTTNEDTHSQREQQQNYSKRDYEYTDYKVEDDILAKWMANAKSQAIELAEQAIKDFKGVSKAAANGCVNGLIHLIAWVFFGNILYFLFKSCNNSL